MEDFAVNPIVFPNKDNIVICIIEDEKSMRKPAERCSKVYSKFGILNPNASHPYKPSVLFEAKVCGRTVGTLGVYKSPVPATKVYRNKRTGMMFSAKNTKEIGMCYGPPDALERLIKACARYHYHYIISGGTCYFSSPLSIVTVVRDKFGDKSFRLLNEYEIVEENVPEESKGLLATGPELYKVNLKTILAKSI